MLQETNKHPSELALKLDYVAPHSLRKSFGFATLAVVCGLVTTLLAIAPLVTDRFVAWEDLPQLVSTSYDAVLLWTMGGGFLCGAVGFLLEEDRRPACVWGILLSAIPICIMVGTFLWAAAAGEL